MGEIVGCPKCATVAVGSNRMFCETCLRRGHTSRMMTVKELEDSLSEPHVKNYPVALRRRTDLIYIMERYEIVEER